MKKKLLNKLTKPCEKRSSLRVFLICISFFITSLSGFSQVKPCLTGGTPECALLNQLWDDGDAAGNTNDWYRNADNDHAKIPRANFPQISDYGVGAFNFQQTTVDAPRVIVGNASLGVNGLVGLVQYYGMGNTFYPPLLHTQYRANQTYWYPAVNLRSEEPTWRDLTTAMFPYANQSIGKSNSEIDEVSKFFHTMAAFKPAVKTKLIDEGLLMPTLQMIFRRTRVANDAEYLTGLAHPTAFDDYTNDVAMINMAQAIETNTIPPMIDLVVLKENYGGTKSFKYNNSSKTEQPFTTPVAISRIFRGTEYTKRMVIDAGGSTDANGLPLTYHFTVLRGDPAHVRITPLNPSGSKVEIEIDYHPEADSLYSNRPYNETNLPKIYRPTSLVIIGAFVNNGSYYSAPGFITSFSLRNETRTYDNQDLIKEILYTDEGVIEHHNLSVNHAWDKDIYTHDFNQRMLGWTRDASGVLTQYTAEGLLQNTIDIYGRALDASEVQYFFTASTPLDLFVKTSWTDQSEYIYTNLSTLANTPLDHTLISTNGLMEIDTLPQNGSLTVSFTGFIYTPDTNFTGIETFVIKGYDITATKVFRYKIRVAVGPTDNTPPAMPSGLAVYGASSQEALLSWQHTTDNVEVYGYNIYRNGSLLGKAYRTTTFSDATTAPGVSYDYTVTAFDDAGNESSASSAVSGGSATLWGQDDFEDGDYTTVDPTLTNGLAWILDSGASSIITRNNLVPALNGKWIRPGVNTLIGTKIMPAANLPTPFLIEFHDAQQFAIDRKGLVFLYQDTNNFYTLEIARDVFALHRTMGGVKTTIGTADGLKMRHAWCSAKFALQVIAIDGALILDCIKSEWTTYDVGATNISSGVQHVQWIDTNATAAATFTSGRLGFFQDTLSTFNIAYYDNILISSLVGNGPDRDADGMADAWETRYYGGTATTEGDPANDSDNDGMTTLEEALAGTVPTNTTSRFEVTQVNYHPTNGLDIDWSSVSGRNYNLLYSTNLMQAAWQPLAGYTNLLANPPTNTLHIASPPIADAQYYKIEVHK